MHFRIFIEGAPATASPDPLKNVGLAHLAEGFHGVDETINGVRGAVYFWPRPGDSYALPKDVAWEWVPAKAFQGLAAGRYLVGLNPEKLPTPTELAVPLQIQGDAIWLGTALNAWVIPDVLFLPARVLLEGDGVRFERLARYQGRTVACGTWTKECEAFIEMVKQGRADGAFEVDWRRAWEFCLQSLQINYRLPVEVAERLDLLTTDRINVILLASIGAYELARAADKREPEAILL